MKKSFKKVMLTVLALTLLVAGCGKKQDSKKTGEEKTKTEATTVKVKDALDREVEVKKDPQSVVLGFSFEEYFAVTGKEGVSKIKGWSRKYWEGRRQSSWDVFVKKFPEIDKIKDVGYGPKKNFSVENVISIKPDVVFLPTIDKETLGEGLGNLEKAGIPVIFLDYHTQSIEQHEKSTMAIGKAMGKEDRAKELMDFYKNQIKKIDDVIKNANITHKPKVYVEFSDKKGPSVYGATYGKKMWGALVEQVGGDNIARDLVKSASEPISPEKIIAANPDIVIFAGNEFTGPKENIPLGYTTKPEEAKAGIEKYKKRTGWESLNAVKNDKMYALYHDLSRHIFDFVGYQFFAKVIQPELFKDLEPEKNLKEFHEKFYPVEYTGTWFIWGDLAK